MYVVNAQEMRELDRQTIQDLGIPAVVLMEVAGRAVAQEVKKRARAGSCVTILAGHGNNGGDGLVAARHLALAGYETHIWLIGKTERMGADVRRFWEVCERLSLPTHVYSAAKANECRFQLERSDIVIDGLLGTGITGDVRPPMRQVIDMLNRSHVPLVVAVDVPSGVDTDSGKVLAEAVRAHCTVTFAFPKWCHYLAPAAELTGELIVADIGIPKSFANLYPVCTRVTDKSYWSGTIRSRAAFSHKGVYGHVLVIGGKRGMAGAPALASRAVLKTGAGLVTTAVPSGIQNVIASHLPEGLTWGIGEVDAETWHADSAVAIVERLHRYDAVVIGPGMGRFPQDTKWLQTLLASAKCPVILDADALNIVADDRHLLDARRGGRAIREGGAPPIVLTPHPGEMARLLQCDTPHIEQKRPQVALELAKMTEAVVVLKGRYSLTAFPDGRQFINTTGTPAMAKGGSGDVLAGMIAANIAQGHKIDVVVPFAVTLHGYAGELAAASDSEYSVLATDIVQQIGPAYRHMMSN